MEDRYKIFTILVSDIMRSIRKIKTEEVAEYNLKGIHVSCLYYLHKSNGLTFKKLCDICEEDKSIISRSIDFLEKEGFLVCPSKDLKRYKLPILLTDKGNQIAMNISDKIDNILIFASVGLEESERQIMYKSLNLISSNLKKICDNYNC